MTTWIRAMIMMSALVAAPAAWVYYGPLPAGAQQAVDRVVALAKTRLGSAAAEQRGSEPSSSPAPLFVDEGAARSEGRVVAPVSSPSRAVQQRPEGAPPLADDPYGVAPLLAELRRQGAAEYALEAWGARGELFRFHCAMPLAGRASQTQHFEAIAADPRAAVQEVCSETSSWRMARAASFAGR